MNGLVVMLIALVVLGCGYVFYGGFLAKKWGIDPKRKTPAYEFEDDVDYIPADKGVVFGHQFASIAGAAPINGPIMASVFGWVPVLLWILLGGIFFGAVQDFGAMYASVRNKGHGLGTIVEEYLGKWGKKLFCVFCWLFCILVVAAFADVVAQTWMGVDYGKIHLSPIQVAANGSTATTSLLFIGFAVVLGLILKNCKFNKWVNTAIAIAFLIASIAIGLEAPIVLQRNTWRVIIFVYIAIATIVPVWILLQPRDYLNSFLLVAMIIAAVVGVFVARPSFNLPTITKFNVGGSVLTQLNTLFPFMFVTVACGAISGFHSLVSSGTASKQIKNEKDMQPISYGAMILESLLAVIALVACASFAPGATKGMAPPAIFAQGVANFLDKMGLPHQAVFTLINLSVSAFALTSLDTVARVGRMSFQEFLEDSDIPMEERSGMVRFFHNKWVAMALVILPGYALCLMGYMNIWPLFGSSNQLLATLALLACAVFFKRTKRLYIASVIPACIMVCVTFTALVIKIMQLVTVISQGTNIAGNLLQLVFAVLITALGVCIVVECFKGLASKKVQAEAEAKADAKAETAAVEAAS